MAEISKILAGETRIRTKNKDPPQQRGLLVSQKPLRDILRDTVQFQGLSSPINANSEELTTHLALIADDGGYW